MCSLSFFLIKKKDLLYGLDLRAPWSDCKIVRLFENPTISTFSKYEDILDFHVCSANPSDGRVFDLDRLMISGYSSGDGEYQQQAAPLCFYWALSIDNRRIFTSQTGSHSSALIRGWDFCVWIGLDWFLENRSKTRLGESKQVCNLTNHCRMDWKVGGDGGSGFDSNQVKSQMDRFLKTGLKQVYVDKNQSTCTGTPPKCIRASKKFDESVFRSNPAGSVFENRSKTGLCR